MNDTPSVSPGDAADAPLAWLDVACHEAVVLVRVGGLGNMHSAVSLHELVAGFLHQGERCFLFGFGDCDGFDSTFMGTLIRLHDQIDQAGGELHLYNVAEHCRDLLAMLGVTDILSLDGEREMPSLTFARVVPDDSAPEERLARIRAAHECLCELNEENRETFGRFLEALQVEMDAEEPNDE